MTAILRPLAVIGFVAATALATGCSSMHSGGDTSAASTGNAKATTMGAPGTGMSGQGSSQGASSTGAAGTPQGTPSGSK